MAPCVPMPLAFSGTLSVLFYVLGSILLRRGLESPAPKEATQIRDFEYTRPLPFSLASMSSTSFSS